MGSKGINYINTNPRNEIATSLPVPTDPFHISFEGMSVWLTNASWASCKESEGGVLFITREYQLESSSGVGYSRIRESFLVGDLAEFSEKFSVRPKDVGSVFYRSNCFTEMLEWQNKSTNKEDIDFVRGVIEAVRNLDAQTS